MNAPDKALKIKAWITAIIGFGTALWGATGWGIIILFAAIVLDYLTGTWAALKNGEWSSSIAREGLWHKLGEITSLLVAMLVDIALQVIIKSPAASFLQDLPLPDTLFTMLVSIWYIFTELGSIIENAAKLGAPVPDWLRKMISKLRDKAEPEIPEKTENKKTEE